MVDILFFVSQKVYDIKKVYLGCFTVDILCVIKRYTTNKEGTSRFLYGGYTLFLKRYTTKKDLSRYCTWRLFLYLKSIRQIKVL